MKFGGSFCFGCLISFGGICGSTTWSFQFLDVWIVNWSWGISTSSLVGEYFCDRIRNVSQKKAVVSIIGIGGMAGGIGGELVSKLGGYLFDYYESLGYIQTGHTILFVLCAVAYLITWSAMKMLVPKYSPITDL